jgi:hypothetical protein
MKRMQDFLIVQTPAMTFLRADTEAARDLLRRHGQGPISVHGIRGDASAEFAAWVLAQGLTFRTGQLADLDGVAA